MKTSDTTKKYDKAHLINLQKYQKAVQSILDKMCEEAAALGISTGFENGSGQNFSWDNFPKARKKFTDLMWRIRKELEASIGDGIETEWKLSNTKNEQLVNELIGRIGLTAKQIEDLEPRRMEGVHAFQSRKVRGLGLSDRVWNITSLVEAQIAEAIEQNLSKGTPAQKLSQAVRQNLKEPDMMYRRYWHKVKLKNGTEKKVRVWHKKVVDSEGNVKFVESPLEAVGTGVYRSAYKNAMRMARTETNMAYHKADSNYFSQSNIILGIEVKLSNNHTTKYGEGEKTKPLVDICDELEGRYPRWFDFTGWHPQCRCVAMPITPDKAEMRKYLKMIANGEDVSKFKFTGEITKLPDNFRNWAINNEDRLVKMQRKGNLPYFIRENLSPNFRFGYGIDIDDAMKWSPYNFDYNEDYDMLMQTEVESFSGEQKTPQQIMQDKEAMIKAMLDNDLAQYSDAIKANIEEIAKLIGQKRGLSMSWEDANTSKENPHYHDKVTRYERDEKGGYIWVKKGRGLAAKETKEYKEHEQWTVNCQTCTLIHELRRRGLNVEACGNKNNSVWKVYDKHGIAHRGQKWMFEDGSYAPYYYAKKWAADNGKNMTTAKHAGEFLKATMKSVGRYEIGITWNARSAHVFSAEKLQDGTLRFFDPQSGESWDFDGIVSGYLSLPGKKYIGELRIIRTDNKLINPKLAETFIPIGELPIDVPNRPDNRELYKAQGEARHAARTPERVEEIKAFYRKWMGRWYKKKAEQRHAERTKGREQEIRNFWAKKKEEGEIRRRQERWDAAKEKRHAERDEQAIREKAKDRQDKIAIAKQKIKDATDNWSKVKDWIKVNPLDTEEAQYHLYDYAVKADELYAKASLILALRPKYEMVAMYKLGYGNYKDLLKSAKQNIIDGNDTIAHGIFNQLDIAKDMEPLYIDMVAYAKAHPSKKAGQQTKIEKAMADAEDYIKNGDFYNAKIKVEEAKKTRDINEASNAQKAAKRKAEAEAKKKAEEAAKNKVAKKTFDQAEGIDDIEEIAGDDLNVMLKGYRESVEREQFTKKTYLDNEDEISGKLKEMFDDSDFSHCTKPYLIDEIFKNGILTNLQTNGGHEDDYDKGRRYYGHFAFNVPGYDKSYGGDMRDNGNHAIPKKNNIGDGEYYRCGVPCSTDPYEAFVRDNSGYGDLQMVFRKDRVVTTFTYGNSLRTDCIPSLTRSPRMCSIDNRTFANWKDQKYTIERAREGANGGWNDYIELQYLPLKGQKNFTPRDFKRIVFADHPSTYGIADDVLEKWAKEGVDVYYIDKKNKKAVLFKKGKPLITQAEAKEKLEAMKSELDQWIKEPGKFESKDISLASVSKLLKGNDYISAYTEVENVKNQMQALKKRADAVRALIPDVDEWNKKFTMDEIETAHTEIAKFKNWFETKYPHKGIEGKEVAKLKAQMDSAQTDDAKKKYKTWQIARDAYKRMYDEKIYQFRKNGIDSNISALNAFKTKDKNFLAMVNDINDLASKGAWSDVETLITQAKDQMLILQQNNGQRVLKIGESSVVKFSQSEFTQAKRDAAKWFKNKDIVKAYKEADDYMSKYAQEMWKGLTDEEKHVLWLYTDGSQYINQEMLGTYVLQVESPIDHSLRNGIADANVLTSIIDKAPALKEAVWMQSGKTRGALGSMFGIDLNRVSDLDSLVGLEGTNNLFMSCHAASDGFFIKGGNTGASNDVIMSIYMPEGTKGAYMEPFASYGDDLRFKDGYGWTGTKRKCAPSDQVEFLLQRGARLKITKAYYKDGKLHVDVDLIEQPGVSALDESMFDARYRMKREIKSPKQRGAKSLSERMGIS